MRSFFIRPSERFSGWINHESREARIHKDSMIRVEGDGRGFEILCNIGAFWITQEDDLYDHFISSGESFLIDRTGLIVVFSLEDGQIRIL